MNISLELAVSMLTKFDGNKAHLYDFLDNCDKAYELVKPELKTTLFKIIETKVTANARAITRNRVFNNWDHLKRHLLDAYTEKRTMGQWQLELNSCRQIQGQNVMSYSSKVENCYIKLINSLDEDLSPEAREACTRLLKEQALSVFVTGLLSDLQILVKSQRPQSLEKGIAVALQEEQELKSKQEIFKYQNVHNSYVKHCTYCDKSGHTSFNCRNKKTPHQKNHSTLITNSDIEELGSRLSEAIGNIFIPMSVDLELSEQYQKEHFEKYPHLEILKSKQPQLFDVIKLIGPLPLTEDGNKYIPTLQDDLTKCSQAFAIPNHEAITIAKKLVENFICKFGIPKFMVTDQGKDFTSELLGHVSKLFKIKHINCTAYHPQSNGALERSHSTLADYLKHYINNDQTDWDKWIDFAMFSYDTTIHTSTKFSPHELLFGNKPNIPSNIQQTPEFRYTYDNYLDELKSKLQKSHQIARENIIKSKETNKLYYDRKCSSNKEKSLRTLMNNSNRVKRGWFNLIGSTFKTIFGTLDQDDAEYYNNAINKVSSNERHLIDLLSQQTQVVKTTITNFNHTIDNKTSSSPISLEDISVDNNASPDEAQPLRRSLRIAQLKDK
nr:unnamed protein product [Callosobruchus analis]